MKLGKDKSAAAGTTQFAAGESIYAVADVSNVPDKITIQWQLIAEDVKGEPKNMVVPQLTKSYDMSSDGEADYTLTPPPSGWPAGTYKIVVTMMEDGNKRDQKSEEFTVSGS